MLWAELPEISEFDLSVIFYVHQFTVNVGGEENALAVCFVHIELGMMRLLECILQIDPVPAAPVDDPYVTIFVGHKNIVLTLIAEVLHRFANPAPGHRVLPPVDLFALDIEIIHPVVITGQKDPVVPVVVIIENCQSVGSLFPQLYRISLHITPEQIDQVNPVPGIEKVLYLAIAVIVNGMHITDDLLPDVELPLNISVMIDKIHLVQSIEGNGLPGIGAMVLDKVKPSILPGLQVYPPDLEVFLHIILVVTQVYTVEKHLVKRLELHGNCFEIAQHSGVIPHEG